MLPFNKKIYDAELDAFQSKIVIDGQTISRDECIHRAIGIATEAIDNPLLMVRQIMPRCIEGLYKPVLEKKVISSFEDMLAGKFKPQSINLELADDSASATIVPASSECVSADESNPAIVDSYCESTIAINESHVLFQFDEVKSILYIDTCLPSSLLNIGMIHYPVKMKAGFDICFAHELVGLSRVLKLSPSLSELVSKSAIMFDAASGRRTDTETLDRILMYNIHCDAVDIVSQSNFMIYKG